tara:strand:+ start:95 stop:1381 length:1287 start_codon:yes stop_codon:yes gene_type:complete
MNIRRVFKNAGILASGDFFAAILGLISFGIIGRTLGASNLGVFSVIVTYVTLIDKFVNFQSWQALIKFGSKLDLVNDEKNYNKLFSFGLFIDIVSALLAFLIAILLCNYLAIFFNWDNGTLSLIRIYSIGILFNIEGTPTALFRIRNKYIYFTKRAMITALVKTLLFILCWFYDLKIDYFIYSTLFAQILGSVFFVSKSFNYAKLTPFSFFKKSNIEDELKKNIGILNFLFVSNIQTSLKLSTTLVDTLLVNKFLGNSATGLFQVVKQFTKIFSLISSPLYKSIYPELVKLWDINNITEFKALIFKGIKYGAIISFGTYLIFALLGKYIIEVYIGKEFGESYYIMLYYFLGVTILVSTFPFSPAILAMGFPKIPLKITFISSLTFITLFILFYEKFNNITIGISYLITNIVWLFLNIYFYKVKLKKLL